MKKLILALLAFCVMASCTEKKVLILYYSQTGTTKAVAEEIQTQTGADICAFDVTQPYEGSFEETIQRCLQERESNVVPELAELDCDLSEYDVIFLGYPIWFGTYAPPVKALLASVDLSGKTIVPFCTFGSGGLQSSMADLKNAVPDAKVKEGYGVRTARVASAAEELDRFLIENGWKEGKVEPLPDYSELVPVVAEDVEIFDAACSGYQFPLGVPEKVASRKTPSGTDYLFSVLTLGRDGVTSESKIYVTVQDGKDPEFTQVVR